MDSTRANQLLSEGKNLIEQLRELLAATYNGSGSARIAARRARLQSLLNRSVARNNRRYDLWCDNND